MHASADHPPRQTAPAGSPSISETARRARQRPPTPGLPARFAEIIRAHSLLHPGEPVVVAVSGGRDSMVLLQLLASLAKETGYQLHVAHLNHQLRGRASNADERLVRETAARLQLPCHVEAADVRSTARARGISLEMAARDLRHDFLARTARAVGARKIALAHHAEDQVETFFLRLFRGTGPEGLTGMKLSSPSPAAPEVQLVRPCLMLAASDLAAYARARRIAFREDASNRRADVPRNRLRQHLLPWIRRWLQPALTTTVHRLIAVLEEESACLDASARTWLTGRPRVRFDRLAIALQRRILHLQLRGLGLEPTFEQIEWLRQNPARLANAPHDQRLQRTPAGTVVLQPQASPGFRKETVRVPLASGSGRLTFGQVRIQWRILNLQSPPRLPRRTTIPHREWLDADRVGAVLELRHWQPGDRFQPAGLPRATKLQDLFTNAKVPRADRHQRVLAVTPAGEICWVEGLRLGEPFKCGTETRRVLEWQWRRPARPGGSSRNPEPLHGTDRGQAPPGKARAKQGCRGKTAMVASPRLES